MIKNIPLSRDPRIKTCSDRIFLGLLWILTKQNTQEGFILKEDLDLLGGSQTYNRISKRLSEQKIVSYVVRGIGTTKHRYFQIIDPEIIEEFKNTSKTLKERKKIESGTQIPPSTQKSILCNSDSDLSDIFLQVGNRLHKDGIIDLKKLRVNLSFEIERFKKYYSGKNINEKTIEQWYMNLKGF